MHDLRGTIFNVPVDRVDRVSHVVFGSRPGQDIAGFAYRDREGVWRLSYRFCYHAAEGDERRWFEVVPHYEDNVGELVAELVRCLRLINFADAEAVPVHGDAEKAVKTIAAQPWGRVTPTAPGAEA